MDNRKVAYNIMLMKYTESKCT